MPCNYAVKGFFTSASFHTAPNDRLSIFIVAVVAATTHMCLFNWACGLDRSMREKPTAEEKITTDLASVIHTYRLVRKKHPQRSIIQIG